MSVRYDDDKLCRSFEVIHVEDVEDRTHESLHMLLDKTGPGNEFLGWMDLPNRNLDDLKDLADTAEEIKNSGDFLVCVGIGGSYLGAKAVISSLFPQNDKIRYAGHHLSPLELSGLLDELREKDFYINVISKSGTTTEPGVAFRFLKQLAEEKYGKNASKRIIATTDASKGALKKLSDEEKYRSFVIPDNVGGRFSVLTPVGLLPILASGGDLQAIFKGARAGYESAILDDRKNSAFRYARNRKLLWKNGKAIEILASFEPQIHFVSEWWKQLFGESEGKDGKGIFPASADFSTDLHSLGQWIQDGTRNIFETFLIIDRYSKDLTVMNDPRNADGLNFLAGQNLSDINRKAFEGTRKAHEDGGVPVSTFYLDKLDEENLFELLVIFEFAIAIYGYTLGVNPFDQPGVEAYKKNMLELLVAKSGSR
jgi:glucose-6-phosphate isomerase